MDKDQAIASVYLLIAFFIISIFAHLKFRPELRSPCKKPMFVEIQKEGERSKVVMLCDNAYLRLLNRCGKVKNGMKIKIFNNGFAKCTFMSAYKRISLGLLISINKENAYGLCAIPNIGPKIAKEIVIYRRTHGGFKRPEELINVKGIGKKLYQKISPYITI